MSSRAVRLAFFLSQSGGNVGQPADTIERKNLTTNHVDATEQVIFAGTLPTDNLARFYDCYLMGVNAAGDKRYDYNFPLSVRRRSADDPDYTVEIGTESLNNTDDPDMLPSARADGDTGFELTAIDDSGDAGVINWNIWLLPKAERTL